MDDFNWQIPRYYELPDNPVYGQLVIDMTRGNEYGLTVYWNGTRWEIYNWGDDE